MTNSAPQPHIVHVPANVKVRSIRAATGMTQAEFAAAFGVPVGTLRDWEQRRATPDMAARAYLLVIKHRPDAVREALLRTIGEAHVRPGALHSGRMLTYTGEPPLLAKRT